MLYIDKQYRKLMESAVKKDLKSNKNDFIKTILQVSKDEMTEDIQQSLTARSSWYVRKLLRNEDDIKLMNDLCNFDFDLQDNTLICKKDDKEITGVNKAFVTATAITCALANKIFKDIGKKDELLLQYASNIKDIVNKIIEEKQYPLDPEKCDIHCDVQSPISNIVCNIAQLILLDNDFSEFEMMLLLIITRIVKSDLSSAIKYLIVLLSKVAKSLDVNSNEVITDLRENYGK